MKPQISQISTRLQRLKRIFLFSVKICVNLVVKKGRANFTLLAVVVLAFLSLWIVDSYLYRRLYPKRPSSIQKNWDVKIYQKIGSKIKKKAPAEKKVFFKKMAPLISCAYVKHPPKIDGKLDDPCWETSPVAENFISPKSFRLAKVKTTVYCLYDRRNIYFGFSCEEPYPNKIRARMRRSDSQLSKDDSIEILLTPFSEKKEPFYYRFVFNGRGTKYEVKEVSKKGESSSFNKKWHSEWEVSTEVVRDRWSAEIIIPFRSLAIKRPGEEESWGINFIRHRYPEGYEKSLWFPVAEKAPSPDSLGSLVFRKKALLARLLAAEYSALNSKGKITVKLNNPFRYAQKFTLKVSTFFFSGTEVKEKKYSSELQGKEERETVLYYELVPQLKRARFHNIVLTLLDDEEKIVYQALLPLIFSPVKPILCCNKVSEPPIIDGNLDDPCWKISQVASNFSDHQGEELAKAQTTGYVVRDNRNLYLALVCEEPFIDKIKCEIKAHDGPVHTDDSIEIFVDSNYDQESYYHFMANINNIHSEKIQRCSLKTGSKSNEAWDTSWKTKTSKGKRVWRMEVSIPLRELRIRPNRRHVGINLNRERYTSSQPEYSCWSCTYGGFNCPFRFGTLLLTEKAPVIEVYPLDEKKELISLRIKNIKRRKEKLTLRVSFFNTEAHSSISSYPIELFPQEEKILKFPYRKKNTFLLLIETFFPQGRKPFFRSIIPLAR